MNTIKKILVILILGATVAASGCHSGKLFAKKSNCGCPSKKGFVGY